MKKLGILFEIDALGSGLYGYAAYKVLFGLVDPRQLVGCSLSDGDTNATLRGTANQYCIALETSDARILDAVKKTMQQASEPGLAAPAKRFITDAAVSHEPLVETGSITSAGELVGCKTGWIKAAHQEAMEQWRHSPPAAPAEAGSAARTWWQFWRS